MQIESAYVARLQLVLDSTPQDEAEALQELARMAADAARLLPPLPGDLLDEIMIHLSAGDLVGPLHSCRDWASSALRTLTQDYFTHHVYRAVNAPSTRSSVLSTSASAINAAFIREAQLVPRTEQRAHTLVDNPLCMLATWAPPCSPWLEYSSTHRNENNLKPDELVANAKVLMATCPILSERLVQTAIHSHRIRETTALQVLHAAIDRCGLPTGYTRAIEQGDESAHRRLAQLILQELVGSDRWHWVRYLLDQDAQGASQDRDGIKRALCLVMRGDKFGLEQKQAVAFVEGLSGRNMFITGAGGCGKSHVLRLLYDALSAVHNEYKLAMLAPTNVAAKRVEGRTFFSWAGLRPRKLNMAEVYPRRFYEETEAERAKLKSELDDMEEEETELKEDEMFVAVRNQFTHLRVRDTKVVFLDEVSMVSQLGFEDLRMVVDEYAAAPQDVQYILAGDFCQLACVKKAGSLFDRAVKRGTVKQYLFQSEAWDDLDLFPVALDVNRRSQHFEFQALLAEARLGMKEGPRLDYVRRKLVEITASHPTPCQFGIFGRRDTCNDYDAMRYADLPGKEMCITAADYPTSWGYKCFKGAPRIITKVGDVMRVTRGPQKGVMGTLLGLTDDKSCLRLETETGQVVEVGKVEYKKTFHSRGKTEIARRWQFSVIRSFGITVHKAQGRSMRSILIGCAYKGKCAFWESGQAYVALSRGIDPGAMVLQDVDKLIFLCDSSVRQLYRRMEAAPLPAYVE